MFSRFGWAAHSGKRQLNFHLLEEEEEEKSETHRKAEQMKKRSNSTLN